MDNNPVDNELYQIWKQFIEGGYDIGRIKIEVGDSWKRCRTMEINPYDKVPEIDTLKLDKLMKKNQNLITVTTPFIKLVHQLIQGTGFIIVLTDQNGYVLDIKGDEQVVKQAQKNNFVICANRSERSVGTNAIGLAIIENKPIQIVGSEHYNVNNHSWTCSAAPIHDTKGKTVGVLNISGHYSLIHKHTLGLAASLVQSINKEFHIRETNRNLELANKQLKAVLDSMSDGVLAIDSNGTITAANSNLQKLFNLDESDIEGKKAIEVLGDKIPIMEVLNSGQDYSDREEFFYVGLNKVSTITTAKQIRKENRQVAGVVGVFRAKKEIHRMVNKIVGAKASFMFDDIIGQSLQMERAIGIARMVAATDTRVLLEGESGTGKELFAQAIHNASKKSSGPFVAINCSAIPRELIESELFGYSDGAFTGARKGGKPGKFELADGGTLFLDEVSSMPLEMQAKLLRVLQQNEISRVGGIDTNPVDVRVIAASNELLEDLVKDGHFRQDLYYRLGVVIINIPPLRERGGDIPILFSYLLEKMCKKMGKKTSGFEDSLISALCSYEWPGNVRELENYIERSVILAQDSKLDDKHFPKKIFYGSIDKQTFRYDSLAKLERDAIEKAIDMFRGNISKASKSLGITRNTLYNKIRDYNIVQVKH